MDKRTLLLLGCFGILVLTTATGLFSPPVSGEESSRFVTNTEESRWNQPNYEQLQAVYGASRPHTSRLVRLPPKVDESTLWLARVIYSETKLPHEQELVAWVVRNRVETAYRGQTSYEDVVLDPYQFSAFNPGSSKRRFYTQLKPETNLPTWQHALWIAYYVRHADPAYRPFSVKTRHFFSEQSMTGRRQPVWANQRQFVPLGWNYYVDDRRFRFYEEIS